MSSSGKRGAPPNNFHALKNGFYSRQFREMENTDLNQVSRGLQDEIRILRVLNRRLAELAEDGCDDPKVLGYILDLVGKTSSRISSLLQADQKLSVENNEFALSLSQALAETVGTLSNPARRKGLKTHG